MAFIKWDDSYSVKVTEIDMQHQKLVAMINELHDAMKDGRGKEVIGKLIIDLIGYTATHFKTEEKYFDQFGYPETDSHKKEHAAFVQKISEFKDGFEKGQLSLTIDVMNFLMDWLLKHIKGADMQYSRFFNSKGLK